MKRMFLLAALAGVALASCTNENFYEQEMENQEISFVPVNKKQASRALISGTAYPTDVHFGVYAWKGSDTEGKNTQAYMTNAEVSLHEKYHGEENLNAWAPDKPFYWPKKDVLDFFAYSPYRSGGTDITVTSSSSISIAHEVNQSTNQDVDLMYTDKVVNKKSNDSSGTSLSVQDGVALTFNHALAQLKFNVKMANIDDGVTRTLTVNSIKLTGINSTGNLKFSGAGSYTVTWEDQGTLVNYENTTLSVTGIGTEGKAIIGADNKPAWLILPQAVGGTLTVNVDIVTGSTTESNIDYTATMTKDQSISTWAMGNIYTYTITLNPVGNEILFVPSVTNWSTDTGALNSPETTE